MQTVSRKTHLMRRQGVFYYRRRVPTELVKIIGRREVGRSLATSKAKEAEKLAAIEDLFWQEQFEAASAKLAPGASEPLVPVVTGPPLSEYEAIRLVRAFVDKADDRARRRLAQDPPSGEKERASMIEDAEMGAQIVHNRDDPRGDELVYAATRKALADSAHSDDEPNFPYPWFSDYVRRGLIELDRRKLGRLQDDHQAAFFDPLFDPARPDPVPFGTVAEQYLEDLEEEGRLNSTSQKWADKQRAHMALVCEIVGSDTPVQAVDYDACRSFRSLLARVPANRNKIYPGLTIHEQIAHAEADGRPGMSFVTQDGYIAALRNVLDLAVKKRLINAHPSPDLRPLLRDKVSPDQKRLPFDNEQVERIFMYNNFYRECAQHPIPWTHARSLGEPNSWRFWLPLLCLLMGMRPNEVCQMHCEDVRCTEKGTWFLEVTATADDDEESASKPKKTQKTENSRRKIPLHPDVLAAGFLDFVRARETEGNDPRLFPSLTPNKYGNYAWYPCKRFKEKFLPEVITLKPRQSLYSCRHSFRDALRRSKAPPEALQGLGGWSQGKLVSDHYGDSSNPDYQREHIEKVQYPGVDLSFLKPKSQ